MGTIQIYSNAETRQFFIQTTQRLVSIPAGFISCTYRIGHRVVKRPELPSGQIKSAQDAVKVYYDGYKQVPFPNLMC